MTPITNYAVNLILLSVAMSVISQGLKVYASVPHFVRTASIEDFLSPYLDVEQVYQRNRSWIKLDIYTRARCLKITCKISRPSKLHIRVVLVFLAPGLYKTKLTFLSDLLPLI